MLDHRFHTFITLCDTLNYTKTAKILCMTQPAVTQHIKYLERYYGCSLFQYEGKHLYLTSKGLELKELVLAMKSNEKKIYDKVRVQQEGIRRIRLATTKSIADSIIPKAITAYMKTYTSNVIDVTTGNTEHLLNQIKTGEIDIAMIEGTFNKLEYDYEVLREEPFLCVASNKLDLTSIHSIEDLFSKPLILREKGSGTRNILESYLIEQCYNTHCFQRQMEADNFLVIKEMVKNDLGITFVYRLVVEQELSQGTLKEIKLPKFPIMRPLYFVYSRSSLFKEEYVEFVQNFKRIIQENV